MILYFHQIFNDIKPSFQNTYDDLFFQHLDHFKCPNERCPHSSPLRFLTSYQRYVYYDIDQYFILNVHVIQCPDCGTSHAVLPSSLLPFSSYTYHFIMRTLFLFFFGPDKGNKSRVCSTMNISRKVLNHFLSVFSEEEVRIAKRKFDLSRLNEVIRDYTDNLYSFLFKYFSPLERIIFLLPHIRRHFFVIGFFPLE